MACRSCHHQGLKPHSFHGSARLKPCPDTNQIITSCSRKCRNSSGRGKPAPPTNTPRHRSLTVAARIGVGELGRGRVHQKALLDFLKAVLQDVHPLFDSLYAISRVDFELAKLNLDITLPGKKRRRE